jgi:hypothetical protein
MKACGCFGRPRRPFCSCCCKRIELKVSLGRLVRRGAGGEGGLADGTFLRAPPDARAAPPPPPRRGCGCNGRAMVARSDRCANMLLKVRLPLLAPLAVVPAPTPALREDRSKKAGVPSGADSAAAAAPSGVASSMSAMLRSSGGGGSGDTRKAEGDSGSGGSAAAAAASVDLPLALAGTASPPPAAAAAVIGSPSSGD